MSGWRAMIPSERLYGDSRFLRLDEADQAVLLRLYSRCDKWGRGPAHPNVLPLHLVVMRRDVREQVDRLARAELLAVYTVDGEDYYQLARYDEDAFADTKRKRGSSNYPPPPQGQTRSALGADSGQTQSAPRADPGQTDGGASLPTGQTQGSDRADTGQAVAATSAGLGSLVPEVVGNPAVPPGVVVVGPLVAPDAVWTVNPDPAPPQAPQREQNKGQARSALGADPGQAQGRPRAAERSVAEHSVAEHSGSESRARPPTPTRARPPADPPTPTPAREGDPHGSAQSGRRAPARASPSAAELQTSGPVDASQWPSAAVEALGERFLAGLAEYADPIAGPKYVSRSSLAQLAVERGQDFVDAVQAVLEQGASWRGWRVKFPLNWLKTEIDSQTAQRAAPKASKRAPAGPRFEPPAEGYATVSEDWEGRWRKLKAKPTPPVWLEALKVMKRAHGGEVAEWVQPLAVVALDIDELEVRLLGSDESVHEIAESRFGPHIGRALGAVAGTDPWRVRFEGVAHA